MDFRSSLIVILLTILVLMLMAYYLPWSCEKSEHFDTYRNHDYWAEKFYHKDLDEAEMIAKYRWREQDSSGRNIYDKYYESISRHNGAYDTKFSNFAYSIPSMTDRYPVTVIAKGNVLHLSQKNY